MELTDELKDLFIQTAKDLTGSSSRMFMARVVDGLGHGGQRLAEVTLDWNRGTVRKGQHELHGGFRCLDAFALRGRQPAEAHLPNLLEDIQALVDAESQTDPRFRTSRLYTRITAAEVRRQLIAQKHYRDAELPTAQTLNTKLNQLGYHLRKVAKTQPQKRIPETDAIFAQLHQVHFAAAQDETVLRLSMDAKAPVKIGPFARGGYNRFAVAAADHDFKPFAKLNVYGLLLPDWDELFAYLTPSKLTSDFIVDTLVQWWHQNRVRFPRVQTLLLNQDNGPENHSRRTQFIKRLVEFATETGLRIQLAYYPPYHSKYNPIERCWGVLEQHWNGALLEDIATAVEFVRTMTWKGKHPVVQWVTQAYATGVKASKAVMAKCEAVLERLPRLGKWFVDIHPSANLVL